jgi:hypothetical protein
VKSDPLNHLNSPTDFASALRRRNRANAWWILALGVVIALLVGGLVVAMRAEQGASSDRDAAAQDRASLAAALQLQREQFRYCTKPGNTQAAGCEKPAAPDPGQVITQGDPGATGPAGPAGSPGATGAAGRPPTAQEIALAVRAYCATGVCVGQPTDAQVRTAVARYCSGGTCRGPAGSNGSNGTDGTDGAAGADGAPGATGPAGPPGPGPTDAQINQAVATYCGNNDCTGPAGPQGPAGYPDSFDFTVATITFVCRDPDGDHHYSCDPNG